LGVYKISLNVASKRLSYECWIFWSCYTLFEL